MNPCSIHYTPLPLMEKRQGSVMERARAERQTGPSCSHGVVLGSLEAAAVVAGPALRAWPSAWRAGWAAGLRGSADVPCNSVLLTLWLQGWWRWLGVLPGAEPMGLQELGPAAFGDTPQPRTLAPGPSLAT